MRRWEIRYENSELPQRYGVINSHRPVVLLNDPHGETVQVVPLTTNTDRLDGCNNEFHVEINSTDRQCVALVDQIRTVPTSELSMTIIGTCNETERFGIGRAVDTLLLDYYGRRSNRLSLAAAKKPDMEKVFKIKMIRQLADEVLGDTDDVPRM